MRKMKEGLPHDVVKVIFSKLPFPHLWNCRMVCKAWNHVALDYILSSKFHHTKSLLVCTSEAAVPRPRPNVMRRCNPKVHSLDLGTNSIHSVATCKFDSDWGFVSIDCSCNGLLYIAKFSYSEACDTDGIWNPMTNEFLPLPGLEEGVYVYGFGFSPKTKQYKLFRVLEEEPHHTQIEVWRFGISNELRSWNCIESLPLQFFFPGVYLDGVIYWIAKVGRGIPGVTREKKKHAYLLHALDVETETFDTNYPSDIGPCSETGFDIQFMSVEGKLRVIIGPCTVTDFKIELNSFNGKLRLIITMFQPIWKMYVWIMGAESWSREFVIDIPIHKPSKLFFVEASENGISLLINDDLYIFDKNGKFKIKIKTLLQVHTNEIKDVHIRIEGVRSMESFQFGSLPKILAGDG